MTPNEKIVSFLLKFSEEEKTIKIKFVAVKEIK